MVLKWWWSYTWNFLMSPTPPAFSQIHFLFSTFSFIRFIYNCYSSLYLIRYTSFSTAMKEHTSKAQWLLYVPPGLTFSNSKFCPHSVFMCFVWIWEQTAIISLYSINWLVFITETGCVYCAVRTGSLYIILRSAHTVYLCVLCGSENKQRLFPYTTLTDWFL